MAIDITTLAIRVTSKDAQAALDAFSKALIAAHKAAVKPKPVKLKSSLSPSTIRDLEKLNAQIEKGSRNAVKFGQDWSGAAKHFHVGKQSVDTARESVEKMTAASNAAAPSLGKLGGIMAGWFSLRRVFSFATAGVVSFAELENSIYKFRVTFEGVSATAQSVAAELMKTYKLSDKSTLGMLSDTGNLLQGFGVAKAESLKMAEAVAKLGIDLASFHGYAGGAAGAVRALNSGLVGNTEALRGLGIVVNMESAQFRELCRNFQETQGMTETQAKAWAILQTAMIQGKNAIGDYLRPGETLNQLIADNIESAERFRSAIGAGLESSAKRGIKSMTGLMNLFNGLSAPTQNLITRTAALATGFIAYRTVVNTLSAAKAIHTRLLGTNSVATISNTAAVSGNTKARGANAAAVGAGSVALAGNTKAAAANAIANAGGAARALAAVKSFSLMGTAAKVAAGSMKLLTRAIPFVGRGLLALDAGMYIFDRFNEGAKAAAEALEKEATKAKEAGGALRTRNDEARNSFERLKTLATYEQLHTDEIKEARAALENIRKVYPDVDITIDATTCKINIQADAFRNLNNAIEKLNFSQAKTELATLEKQIASLEEKYSGSFRAFWTAAPGKNTNSDEYTTLFGVDSVAKRDRKVRDQLSPLYQQRDQLRQTVRNGGKSITPDKNTGSGSAQFSDANKGYRAAVQAFRDAEWNIDYNTAGSVGKVQMIDERMSGLQKQIRGFQQRAAAGEAAPQGEADYKTQAVQKYTELLELERKRGAVLEQQKETQAAINAEFERYAKLSMSPTQQATALLAKMQTVKAQMQELRTKAASGELAPVGQKPYEDQFREKQREYLQLAGEARSQRDGIKGSRDRIAAMIQTLGGKSEDPKKQLADIGSRARKAMQSGDYNGVMNAAAEFDKFRRQEVGTQEPHPVTEKSRWMTNTMQEGIEANSSKARMLEARSFVRPKDQDPNTALLKSNNDEIKRMSDLLMNALSQYLQTSGQSMNQLSAALSPMNGG